MIPVEFRAYVRGVGRYRKSLQWLLAWHAALIMNCWRGKNDPPIEPQQLMGEPSDLERRARERQKRRKGGRG